MAEEKIDEEKIRFLKSKDGKDVVIKLSEYGSKLTSNGRVMYEINKADEDAEQKQAFTPEIKHGMMNNWTVSVPGHSTVNFNYIDWIAVETNYGIHVIQVGPQKEPVADFNLAKGERIIRAYAYECSKNKRIYIKTKNSSADAD